MGTDTTTEPRYVRTNDGATVHRSTCRYAGYSGAAPWHYADGFDNDKMAHTLITAPWLSGCRVCRPGLPS